MINIQKKIRALKVIISSEIYDRGALGLSFKYFKYKHPTKNLNKYYSIHEGDTCFIVGTGPSLTVEDVELLRGRKCFGVNTLFKIYEKTDWRPDYYCVIDPNTYSNIRDSLNEYNVNNIFIAQNRMKSGYDSNCIPFNLNCSSFYQIGMTNHLDLIRFSSDISDEISDGASVVYATLQIAIYMGFKTIYLLGVDCNYDKNLRLHSSSVEYSTDYDYNWTKQTGLTMIEGFKVAKKYADEHGINVYNATRGGMLEVFPRVKLEDVVGGVDE